MRRPTRTERPLRQPHADELDTRPDVLVAKLAAREKGVLSLGDLRRCGLDRQAVLVRTRNGRLHRVHHQVYAVGHPMLSLESWFLAAVKTCAPNSVLSHFAAASLRSYERWDHRDVEVTVFDGRHMARSGLRVHRTTRMDPADLSRVDGIPVTSPARTLLDLASVVDGRRLRRALNQALSLREVTVGELADVLARVGPRRGSRALADLVARGPAPTRSELEDRVLALFLDGGLERPDVNEPLHLSGRTVYPDFRWPDQRLVVEADGAAWHDNLLARENDAERQAALEAHGERVLRVTWDQAVLHPDQTLQRVLNHGAPLAERPPRQPQAD